jgi:uncharacterized protein YdhG (YjbR/CyaY superfamily)
MAKTNFQSVREYIAHQPAFVRPFLERVRATIKKALPRATEGISYRIPVVKLDDRMVLYFAGYERHYSIYPATARLVAALRRDLAGALFHRATIRFSVDRPVPTALIARIAKLRAAETREHARVTLSPVRKKAPKKAAKKARKAPRRTSKSPSARATRK